MSSDSPTPPRVRPPRQPRSQRSLDRILGATRRLLEDRTFAELSIADVVRAAGSSVGAFYARFADKQALLDHLDELYARDLLEAIRLFVEDPAHEEADLRARLGAIVRFLVRFHRDRRGLLRALILHARLHVDGPFGERTRRMLREVERVEAFVLHRRDEIPHPRPDDAVRFGFVVALTVIRERILFPEGPAALIPLDDEALAEQVARTWLALLGGAT